MMNNRVLVHKPISFTPLQTIKLLQEKHPEYQNVKIGYAGRLDPMAEGLLVLLINDENKKKKEYEKLEKTYTFEFLLGIETDSYDLLGLVQHIMQPKFKIENLTLKIPDILNSFQGTSNQFYPQFSAARVNGKPLYYWARKGMIDKIKIPTKSITITDLGLQKIESLKLSTIQSAIMSRIQSVQGDFRQGEILHKWDQIFVEHPNFTTFKLTCSVSCSSGTYVRSIVSEIGKKLKVGAVTFSIKRVSVGPYKLHDAIYL